jgi:diacylglycerol kinase (ATP)
VLALAVPLAFVVGTGVWQRLILVGVILFLIAVELINTAVEKLSDHVTATHHPEIGKIKDMTSAAVGVAIAIAGLTWLVALGERAGLW